MKKVKAQECDCDFISSGYTVVEGSTLKWYEETHVKDPIEKRGFDGNYWLWDYPNYSRDYVVVADVGVGILLTILRFMFLMSRMWNKLLNIKVKLKQNNMVQFLTSV